MTKVTVKSTAREFQPVELDVTIDDPDTYYMLAAIAKGAGIQDIIDGDESSIDPDTLFAFIEEIAHAVNKA